MPGGNKNIKPSDNPRPFGKDFNGKNFEKWTEEKIHQILDELVDWLLEEVEIKDDKGNLLRTEDAGNVFYSGFLYKKGLFDDWIGYVKRKFDSVKERFKYINKVKEYKLQFLAVNGKTKEGITKFILSNKHGWKEKSEHKNINKNIDIIWNETKREQ